MAKFKKRIMLAIQTFCLLTMLVYITNINSALALATAQVAQITVAPSSSCTKSADCPHCHENHMKHCTGAPNKPGKCECIAIPCVKYTPGNPSVNPDGCSNNQKCASGGTASCSANNTCVCPTVPCTGTPPQNCGAGVPTCATTSLGSNWTCMPPSCMSKAVTFSQAGQTVSIVSCSSTNGYTCGTSPYQCVNVPCSSSSIIKNCGAGTWPTCVTTSLGNNWDCVSTSCTSIPVTLSSVGIVAVINCSSTSSYTCTGTGINNPSYKCISASQPLGTTPQAIPLSTSNTSSK